MVWFGGMCSSDSGPFFCVRQVERRGGGGDGVFVEDEVICGHGLFGAGCVLLDFPPILGQSCNARFKLGFEPVKNPGKLSCTLANQFILFMFFEKSLDLDYIV